MTEQVKKKYENFVTPIGVATYPWLFKPNTTFKVDGVYSINLTLSAKDAKTLKKEIDDKAAEALVEAKKDPVKGKKAKPCDNKPYTENEDGTVSFKFKKEAVFTDKETGKKTPTKVFVMDSSEPPKPITAESGIAVYSGSKVRVSYRVGKFNTPLAGAGANLKLVAVQIIELSKGIENGAKFGFEAVEGGLTVGAEEASNDIPFDSEPSNRTDEVDEEKDFV